jgi:hypothetical protein
LATLLGEARLLLTQAFSFDTLLCLPNLRLHGSNVCFVLVHTDIFGCPIKQDSAH